MFLFSLCANGQCIYVTVQAEVWVQSPDSLYGTYRFGPRLSSSMLIFLATVIFPLVYLTRL